MHTIKNQKRATRDASRRRNQNGFSLIELMVAMTVMLIVVGAVFALMRDSMKVAMTTYELTDAQQNLRTAQEFISRDVMYAGDGLKTINNIRVPLAFVQSYVTPNPLPTPVGGIVNLPIFTTQNDVAAGLAVTGAVPAATIRTGTDRQTIMEIDPGYTETSLTAGAIDAAGSVITLPVAPANLVDTFTVGEVYFLTSSAGATFGTITSIDTSTRKLSFASGSGDPYGLNLTGAGGHILTVSGAGTLPTSLQRMRLIQYYVTTTGLLMRRVFGVKGAGFREAVVAEHVLNVQFNYSLIVTNLATGVVTPSTSTTLTTSEQQLAVRQVEIRVTVETPHFIQNGSRQPMTMTTSVSVRNMQFRQAL